MILKPANVAEVQQQLRTCRESVRSIDLSAFDRVLEYHPEDMTVTVQAGVTLANLQQQLGIHRQWLPIDSPKPLTIGALLATNASGPRRYGYGTVREYLLGLTVVLADGRVVKSGGKVVKNVAGYDLQKLFVGGFDSLGIIVDATFKVLPLPACERILQTHGADAVERVVRSPLTPTILDLHKDVVVLGLAGTTAEVDWQVSEAAKLGFVQEGNLDYDQEFWSREPEPWCRSVLPSKLTDTLKGLTDYVARAGNGVIYYRGTKQPERTRTSTSLARRLKETFDPNHILPDLPW